MPRTGMPRSADNTAIAYYKPQVFHHPLSEKEPHKYKDTTIKYLGEDFCLVYERGRGEQENMDASLNLRMESDCCLYCGGVGRDGQCQTHIQTLGSCMAKALGYRQSGYTRLIIQKCLATKDDVIEGADGWCHLKDMAYPLFKKL
tara:strand:+ start:78 stop:512 length:435 start_codon:yes stop_codon:yes gene_type:complete